MRSLSALETEKRKIKFRLHSKLKLLEGQIELKLLLGRFDPKLIIVVHVEGNNARRSMKCSSLRKNNKYAWNTVYTYIFIYTRNAAGAFVSTDTFNNFMLLAKDV